MMEYLPQLALAWSIQLTGVLSPGPSVALILGIATSQGRGAALATVAGIGAASIVLALATVLGIAVLVAQVAEVMTLIRWIGAAYLAWLAYGAFKKALAPPHLDPAAVPKATPGQLAAMGFALHLSNPKAILFWLALAGVGGVGDAPASVVVLFVLGSFFNSIIGHAAWALMLSSAPVRRVYQSARRGVETVLGGFYTAMAFGLATARS